MRSKIHKIFAIPAFLLSLCVMAVCAGAIAKVPVFAQSADGSRAAVTLELNKQNPEENVPFRMMNMFPGDSETRDYKVSVSYTGEITVYFQASAPEGGEKLGEVLMVKVSLPDEGEVLYEGTLAGMPAVRHKLSTDKASLTEDITYEITVGLSTSVGNEYQNKSLSADLNWWAEGPDPENPTPPDDPEEEEEPDVDEPEGGSLVNPPTGDDSQILLWLMVMIVAMAAMILLVAGTRRSRPVGAGQAQGQVAGLTKSGRKLFFGILLVVCLVIGLGVTSLALIYQKVAVEENLFVTGQIKISLNDGEPVFRENMLFEPGMVVKKEFKLRNDSTCDVHYRLYFSNVDGEFAEVLQVEVYDKQPEVPDADEAMFKGTLQDMNGQKSEGADGFLREGEERIMTIVFRVPEDCGNDMQGRTILFDLNADAVQVVNNPDGLFE